MSKLAIRHISKSDPVMKLLIRQAGKYGLEPKAKRAPFESLVRAVAHQQLHANAAESILRRFLALYPGKKFPKPEDILATPSRKMRAVGFSEAKVLAIKDIAAKTVAGIVPSPRKIVKMSDEEIIERLTQVRGVGRWTVEMLLIFQLGRMDVLPIDDFGVRNGYRLAFRKKSMPKPKQLHAYGMRWAPYRTVAAWYLWRAVDLHRLKTKKSAKK